MISIDQIIKSAKESYADAHVDPNGRYRSWEHCYKAFIEARETKTPDEDLLALNLAFYLASWGMYRGSSFLLKKDYKIHTAAVHEILKPKYNILAGTDYQTLKDNLGLVIKLGNFLKTYYYEVRKSTKTATSEISDVLITKILMGTLGCVPAYDRFFKAGVKAAGVTTQLYGASSLRKLTDFYRDNEALLEKARADMRIGNLKYPQMKVLDMAFWKIGGGS